MKKFVIYLLLIIVLGSVLYNLWNTKNIIDYAMNGGILLLCIVVYKWINYSENSKV